MTNHDRARRLYGLSQSGSMNLKVTDVMLAEEASTDCGVLRGSESVNLIQDYVR
jgi:hypothetical protein